ncbi:DnaJ5: heat shock protein [Desulfosarcina variabilis str. Montpellier]|uniref:J domain-containing protein n=1 Tax=Desulfosarcina variabilis TaxID=2300 RepID=UPI003AFB38CF
MYLACLPDKKNKRRYMIRQSYADGDCYRSRDLFDLGDDPGRFIKYPGGNGFYIDTAVEEAIAEIGVNASQEDLEPIFMPFIDPQIRRVIDGFDRRAKHHKRGDKCIPAEAVHRFDRYRLHFLKLGRIDPRRMGCMPGAFYADLIKKSRDEIEYDFITAEKILKPHELALYTYQIFDLQRYFNEHFAHSHPEALDQQRMDRFFMERLCRLNADESFWIGSDKVSGLHQHLVRYAVMYFDSSFPTRDPFQDFLRDFINRHRFYRPPESVKVSLAESARLFGVSVEALKKMDRRALARQYRKLALMHHPDKGGDTENFVKLTAAYQKLMKRKSCR